MTLLDITILYWFLLLILASWLLPKKWQPAGIAVITATFMVYYVPDSFVILAGSSVFTYGLMRINRMKAAMVFAIVAFFSVLLVYYKVNSDIHWFDKATDHLLPLGLSYYSFRQIHYIFENYKQKLPPHTFGDYLCYLFFLPTLFIGPIHRFPPFLRYLRRRRWDANFASQGLERMLYGYVKILFLANYLVEDRLYFLIDKVPAENILLREYLDAVRYGCNLYFQFSGYSDVAIGLSLILGFKIIENFNFPFLAVNISDFWSRWHASLSSWCRDYVFLPVASITRIPQVAIICSMLVLGLWHAVSLQYVSWGLYHGFGIATWHQFQKVKKKLPLIKSRPIVISTRIMSNFVTMNFVILGFIITKEKDMSAVIEVVKQICYSL